MKTDKLFYEFFQLAPQALFELLQITPACAYRFESLVVKASEKRMDGLLEPAELGQPHYFLEVQGYMDPSIYWRVIHQIGIYHEQRPYLNGSDWQAVVLFLDASHDPGPETLGRLCHGNMPWLIHGVLPDLLRQAPEPSPVLNVLRPLVVDDETVQQQAAGWAAAIRQLPDLDAGMQARLLKLLVQFIIQRFSHLGWKEIEAMLQLTPIEETVAGRELIQRGLERGLEQGREQEAKKNVIEILKLRFGRASRSIMEAIEQMDDLLALKTLLRQAVTADSLASFEAGIVSYA